LIDDALGGWILYTRLSVHYDFFNFGIAAGKIVRIVFQIYLGGYMLWDYILKNIG
jgi:hypothetical protein